MDASFEDVVKLAEKLDSQQQNLLIYRLRVKQLQARVKQDETTATLPRIIDPMFDRRGMEYVESYRSPTREELLQEVEALRQTPVHPGDSLYGKFANPNLPEMSEEEFHAQMHAIATEWEQELDDFYNDRS